MPHVDLTGVETEFTPVPPGTYECSFVKFENAISANSGQPTVKLRYQIVDGDQEGRVLFQTVSLQRQALFSLKRTMQALGADEDILESDFDTDEELPRLLGSRVKIVTSMRDGVDKTGKPAQYNNIDEVLPF